jgi:hypothetical protein
MTCKDPSGCQGYISDTEGFNCDGWCESCGTCYGDDECSVENCWEEIRWNNVDRREVSECLGED